MHQKDEQLAKYLARDTRKILGDNVRRLREWYQDKNPDDERGKQQGIAKLSGIHQTTVGRIEAGSYATRIDSLVALAKAFKVEPWQLLVPDLQPDNPFVAMRKTVYERIRETFRGFDDKDLPPPP